MHRSFKLFAGISVGVLLTVSLVRASISTVSQQVGLINPPPSVVPGALVSNSYILMFLEKYQYMLTAPLNVDIAAAGLTATTTYKGLPLPGGTIAAGTVVNSYYVHANVNTTKRKPIVFTSQLISFTSEEEIIGIQAIAGTFQASDALLGAPSTVYDKTDSNIGLAFGPPANDSITMTATAGTTPAVFNSIGFQESLAGQAITEFRIITTLNRH